MNYKTRTCATAYLHLMNLEALAKVSLIQGDLSGIYHLFGLQVCYSCVWIARDTCYRLRGRISSQIKPHEL